MILNIWKLDVDSSTFSLETVIDTASSIIWVTRFQDVGQFELYISALPKFVELFRNNEIFITRPDRTRGMYVETVDLTENAEEGDYLTITGRSAEIMLTWRAVPFTDFTDSEQLGRFTAERIIRNLMGTWLAYTGSAFENENAVPFLTLEESHSWDDYTQRQFTGKTLLNIMKDLCSSFKYGFRFVWTGAGFQFQLYKGTDRSEAQTENTFVIFSPDFNNLTSSEYIKDNSNYYNSAIVAGQGEGIQRTVVYCYPDDIKGFKRRTIWVDARQSAGDGNSYRKQLKAQGDGVISEHPKIESFTGEVFTQGSYVYGVDYELGDKVSVRNAYGISGTATVVEITEVEDAEGYRLVPTLSDWTIIPTEEDN